MSGFNTSTRKEDISVRLRAQNLKHARDQTKRLEEDNRKMEERLRELKTAMNREKEDRERKGGGFWSKGQTNSGSLTNYASEVLKPKADKPAGEGKKKRVVKILQDEPIDIPKRPNHPGTMNYIAQRKPPTNTAAKDKLKGPKCGQCEDRTATLTCVQCSEIFCFGCFSAFHLKGALKQHRSVPLSASGPRISMSPRLNMDSSSQQGSHASGSIVSYSASVANNESGAAQASVHISDSSLLQGNYDESQSAASFQQALMAWRQGEPSNSYSPNANSPNRAVSPVILPVRTLDESTGTTQQNNVPEIKFKSTLSYAERLMLKKHRRTELAETFAPQPPQWSGGSAQQFHSSSPSSSSRALSAGRNHNSASLSREGTLNDEGERVDFQSLFEAVVPSPDPPVMSASPNVTVTPLSSTADSMKPDKKTALDSSYIVREASPLESWHLENNIARESRDSHKNSKHLKTSQTKSTPRKKQEKISQLFQSDPEPEPFKTTSVEESSKLGESSVGPLSDKNDAANASVDGAEKDKTRLKPPVEQQTKPKPEKTKSRPVSRAQSRAASKIEFHGLLTKAPSEALKHISQLAPTLEGSSVYQSPMEGFFLAGVESEGPPSSRKSSPSKMDKNGSRPASKIGSRPASRVDKPSITVSNRLYQMAPRSWRPESSLGETIPLNEVKPAMLEEMVLSYSYSGQISGQAVQCSPSSSQSRSQTGLESQYNPLLVFGDEMFIEVAALQTSKEQATPKTDDSQLDRGDSNRIKPLRQSSATTPTLSASRRSRTQLTSSPAGSVDSNTPSTKSSVLSKSKNQSPSPAPPQPKDSKTKLVSKDQKNSVNSKSLDSKDSPALIQSAGEALKLESSKIQLNKSKQSKTGENATQKEATSSRQNVQNSKSDISHVKSLSSKVATSSSVKQENNVLKRQQSDAAPQRRPVSSVVQPLGQSNKGPVRPNSTTGTSGALKKTQQSLQSLDTEDTIISDVMMSRVQEDGWVADDDGDESDVGFDYDDGDDITPVYRKFYQKQMFETDSEKNHPDWETEVRPFSGLSSRTDLTPSNDNKLKRPFSSRASGRESRAVVVDGEDLSFYDDVGLAEQQDMEDKQALDQLEWELASDTGRLTADGKVSRMSIIDDNEPVSKPSKYSVKQNADKDYDLAEKLREDETNAEREVDALSFSRNATVDEDEVRALR
ncbi:zinc finger B-box domain-containing protein 1-like [Physella acuta]|uniref:zinc finger B-box domain-containing protein 1-like n=1 Tax=Physella acuta TaxID=109671 RepID=UPI0027DB3215|nr:zinc finger B-box domain-containing protein 1-like [Physella acuta]